MIPECTLDGLSHREPGPDTIALDAGPDDGALGRLLAVLLLRTAGVSGPSCLAIRQPTIRIGRDASAGLVLAHPSVSAAHAEIRLRGGVWTLSDLDSENGTWVDGEPVLGALPLAPGSEIRLGEVVLAFNPRDRWEDSLIVEATALPLVGVDGLDADAGDQVKQEIVSTPRAHPSRAVFGGYGFEEVAGEKSRSAVGWVIAVVAVAIVLFLLYGNR